MNKKTMIYVVLAVLAAVGLVLLVVFTRDGGEDAATEDENGQQSPEGDQTDDTGQINVDSGEAGTIGPAVSGDATTPTTDSNQDTPPAETGQTTDPSQAVPPAPAGLYIENYSEAVFNEHSDKQRWLYFHADWCPQCQALDADIRANLEDIPSDVVILKVDYDNSDDLRQRYDVAWQTTIVSVDGNGQKIKLHRAVLDQTLVNVIENLQ